MTERDRKRGFSFSSETAVERWFGFEILDHSPKSVRMGFMSSGRAPLLMGHDQRIVLGVVETASINKDRVGRGVARFGRSTRSEEALRDVDDGILVNTSVGYRVHEMKLESSKKDVDTYRITDWEPFEGSLVGIPADPDVGVGRYVDDEDLSTTAHNAERRRDMSKQGNAPAGASAEEQAALQARSGAVIEPGRQESTQNVLTAEQLMQERRRIITNLCVGAQLDERFVENFMQRSNLTYEQISEEIVTAVAERTKAAPQTPTLLGMERREVKRYSLMRALRAASNKDWKDAGLELDANTEISKALNQVPKSATSFFVPLDVLMREIPRLATRDMTVAGVSGSQFLVSTDNQPGSFIDLLRNTSVALRLGVSRLTGLKGNVTIPKMTAGNTAFWLADEATQITESQPTIGQLSLAPKNVAALTELSHQLMQQSTPDAETLVLNSIARDIGLAVDVGILRGSGAAGQPTGIATTAGIGTFSGTSLAAPGVLNAQGDVAAANALYPGCGFATTPAVAELLMARPELPTTGTERLWKGNMLEGTIFNWPAMSSAQMSAATMLFGWWPSVILAEWGVLELMLNPFSDFTRGLSAIRGWYTCDVGVRYAGAWSLGSTIT